MYTLLKEFFDGLVKQGCDYPVEIHVTPKTIKRLCAEFSPGVVWVDVDGERVENIPIELRVKGVLIKEAK